ncbi:MAG TPA: protein kinase [Verrucomicrobiae bacterium]|nr:protein kinase [Verrucomicrobiae bacterium]
MTPRASIGHYRITAKLGEGGMGTVYRATDTRLNRDVAIKVLPEAFAQDAARMQRFEREARLLASLDHPNIGAIYGLEEIGGGRALILALIEGPTLAERIATGPIPLEDAIPIARQIAEALEYAHERGVIHRDLKPANVKVTPQGAVKVLDFGLAKALAAEGEAPAASPADSPTMSPTLSMRATQAGVILGTAAYMAPEQAKGKAVDKRADIWAFGVVLFEMLCGEPLFRGDSIAEILASAIKEDPKLDRLRVSTPIALRRLIERCLQKDPRQRLRDIGEARIVLQNASQEPEAPVIAAARTPSAGKWPWIVAGTMAALALVFGWALWRAQRPTDRPLLRLDVDLGTDVSLPPVSPGGSDIAISPDGRRLAYISGTPRRLFVRRLDQSNATALPGTEGAAKPFFSPDGQWIGFDGGKKVEKISVDGGTVVPIGDSGAFGGGSWAPDGSIFVSIATTKGLLRFPPGGGPPETLAPLAAGETALNQPQILPREKAVLFCATTGSADRNTVEVLTLADGRRKIVVRGGISARYLPTSDGVGYLVYLNRATLFAVPFDLAKLETRGTARPVLDDVAYYPATGAGQYDFSAAPPGHGALVYRRNVGGAGFGLATLEWVDSTGKREALPIKPGSYRSPSISPDGKRIALVVRQDEDTDIWIYDPQRDAMTRLTFGGSDYRLPVWSRDGRYVVFDSRGKGIFQARADGASQPQPLIESQDPLLPSSFSPDGKRLTYSHYTGGSYQIWTVPLEDSEGRLKAGKPEQFLKSSFNDSNASFSPDGRWLAYASSESGSQEVFVRPFPPPSSGPGGKWEVSNGYGSAPHWSPNGHDLVYRSEDQVMVVSYTVKGDAFVAEKPRVWIAGIDETMWDLAPDGKRVLLVARAESPESPKQEHEVVFLENFFDYLRQRVPAGK